MAGRRMAILFPIGGLDKRHAYQKQPPWTTPACSNVLSDGTSTGRERGGSRPGINKLVNTQVSGSNPVRGVWPLRFINSGSVTECIVATANGNLSRTFGTSLTAISSATTLNSAVRINAVDYEGKLYIADYGDKLREGTAGTNSGLTTAQFKDGTTDFAGDYGVNDDDHALVITSHAAVNCIQEILISGTPTGGLFLIYNPDDEASVEVSESVSTADLQTALETLYGTGNVDVGGSAGANYTVEFIGDLAGTPITAMEVDGAHLTGGSSPAVTCSITQDGWTSTSKAGVYNITSITGGGQTLNISPIIDGPLTSAVYYIARCPKIYDPVANTLTKWIQANDDDGAPKGAIPIGRSCIEVFNDRLVLAGGVIDPTGVDFSRAGNPLDWDAAQDDVAASVIASQDDNGRVPEPVTAIIAHGQSCLLIGCKHSLWVLRGDITAGAIVNLSKGVGVIGSQAWCTTDDDYFVFLSLDGVYAMSSPCGGHPESISRERLPTDFLNTAVDATLTYDPVLRKIHVWLTDTAAITAGINWFIAPELDTGGVRTPAFFPFTLGSHNFEAYCATKWRSLSPSGAVRNTVLGCRDGYLRKFQPGLARDDNATAFASYFECGPIQGGGMSGMDGLLNEMYCTVPAASGGMTCTIYAASSPDALAAASVLYTATWASGLTTSSYPRLRGNAFKFRVTNTTGTNVMEFESFVIEVQPAGRSLR